jgi:ubiquitin-protein ligase
MSWNTSNPAIKRLMKEMQSLEQCPSPDFVAYPMEDNMFQWHFTMRGPSDSPYADGLYHGKLLLPPNYPFAPPDVVLLTPNGRFELNKKICVSITSYHPENWNPTFNIVTVLSALREFMSTPGNNAIGAIEYAEDVRRRMSAESVHYECPYCKQTNVQHRETMKAVPPGNQTPMRVEPTPPVTPVPVSQAHPPITPPAVPLPRPAEGDDLPEPPIVPAAAEHQDDVPPLPVIPPPQHRPRGIVVNVRTLDNIIGIVFCAILMILVKKYVSGNLADVMNFHV